MSGRARGAGASVGTELQFGPLERSVRLSRPRLQTFDYRGRHAYHVVVVVNRREPVFTDVAQGRWCINTLDDVASGAQFDLLAYCLMPDHLHVLALGMEDSSHLVTFMQRFKRRTGYHFKRQSGDQLWQSSYFDRVLRKEEDVAAVAAYVFQNPVVAGLSTRQEDYPLSGGVFFGEGQPDRTEVPSLRSDS